jgi:exodeoxyribonuclease VII large subunit
MDAGWRRVVRTREARLAAVEARLRRQDVSLHLAVGRRRLESLRTRLERVSERETRVRRIRVERAEARLEGMSPLAVLGRGYALVYAADGRLLTTAAEARVGQDVVARLSDGRVRATVVESTVEG